MINGSDKAQAPPAKARLVTTARPPRAPAETPLPTGAETEGGSEQSHPNWIDLPGLLLFLALAVAAGAGVLLLGQPG